MGNPAGVNHDFDALERRRFRALRLMQQFVAAQKGRIHIEFLPAYAPELNPTEYIWGHAKHHKLHNAYPNHFAELKHGARRALRNMRRPTLITAFWEQASLWPE